jgi:hypothetical protein
MSNEKDYRTSVSFDSDHCGSFYAVVELFLPADQSEDLVDRFRDPSKEILGEKLDHCWGYINDARSERGRSELVEAGTREEVATKVFDLIRFIDSTLGVTPKEGDLREEIDLEAEEDSVETETDSQPHPKSLTDLQVSLPWTGHYHRDFRSNPQTHKDFDHALLHVIKSAGRLASIINEAEHGGYPWDNPEFREPVENNIADFVICALRMANTCPDGVINLQSAVERRISTKNNLLSQEKRHDKN